MATINFATRQISGKVVYFGAERAGCNTSVERLHALAQGKSKSPLHRFGPKDGEERSAFFSFETPQSPIEGFGLLVSVYSLPGGIELRAHREEVLYGVDAVIFVADARGERNPTNVDALLDLEALLSEFNRDLSALPVVLQVNHTDAPTARPVQDVVFDLNPFGFPVKSTVAQQDLGVVETFDEALAVVNERFHNTLRSQVPNLQLTAVHDPTPRSDADVLQAHLVSIAANAEAAELEVELEADEPPPVTVEDLPAGPEIEVPFQPRELLGSFPVQVLGAEIDGDRVRVELLMERTSTGESRRLTVMLANRPTDSTPPRTVAPSTPDLPADSVFDYLPDEDVPIEEPPTDLPAVLYGFLGVASGIAIGLLSSYLLGAWF